MKRTSVILLAVVLVACAKEPAPDQVADSIYFNGTIITMNDAVPSPEAVVVKHGRIVDMGTFDAMHDLHAGTLTRMVDLHGGAMFPGFVDATQQTPIETVLAAITPESKAGSGEKQPAIQLGESGDFVILDRNPLEIGAGERGEIRLMKVVRAGETVFRRQH